MMRRVLLIAYYHPPLGLSGVHRVVRFEKYLLEYGYEPVVLTPKPGAYYAYDDSLLVVKDVCFTESLDLLRILRLLGVRQLTGGKARPKLLRWIEKEMGWIPFAIYKGYEMIKCKRIELIFATSPPVTDLIIGAILKTLTGVPLVIDLRDPWVSNNWVKRWVYGVSDHIVVLDEAFRKYVNGYDKVEVIPTPYDMIIEVPKMEIFSILYPGLIRKLAPPYTFIKGIDELIDEGKIDSDKIEVNFVGHLEVPLPRRPYIKHYTYVPYHRVKGFYENSVLLLLLVGKYEPHFMITCKLFEYMGMPHPVIAIAPKGVRAREMVEEYSIGEGVDPDDIDGIKRLILKYYNAFYSGDYPWRGTIERFHVTHVVGKLASIFDKVANR